MQIQINTDRNIDGREALAAHISSVIEQSLSRFNEHITRVEVHLSDENSDKKVGKDGLKCVMEARIEGRRPLAATHQATTLEQAFSGAADKLARLIENTIGRSANQRGHRADPPPSGLDVPEDEQDE
ncbi:MAG: ribosomal subunit interface protein [Geobacteraceae bacterium GWC2_55_20]|nr:MAG: ribosomal subunit interface protein [Geobacteraceae bacterium GWC2_55_20]OGU25782.1 MAG: ribosomal subunit interface protein [Geobacteraceae bacterium GWF2_54_21]HBA70878.1 ribosomal subunit interface protein [Geobacter sp.]HCE68155.1 ribosomal subunit interface protein [Geobacter sp.]